MQHGLLRAVHKDQAHGLRLHAAQLRHLRPQLGHRRVERQALDLEAGAVRDAGDGQLEGLLEVG